MRAPPLIGPGPEVWTAPDGTLGYLAPSVTLAKRAPWWEFYCSECPADPCPHCELYDAGRRKQAAFRAKAYRVLYDLLELVVAIKLFFFL